MSSIPEGFQTITPHIVVSDGAKAIDLYKPAFEAEEIARVLTPGTGKILHACLQIGSSKLFLCDEVPEQKMLAPKGAESGAKFYLYFDDVDAQHQRAVAAGMIEQSAPMDMFWGDRMSVVEDPFGHTWQLATHVRDVSDEEIAKAMEQMAG